MTDVLTPITRRVPFSIALVMLIAISAGFLLLWMGKWIQLRRGGRRSHLAGLWWGVQSALVITPVLLLWFVIFWGAGYRRVPLETRLNLDTAEITSGEAAQLRMLLLDTVRRESLAPVKRNPERAVAAVAGAMTGIVTAWDGRAITLPHCVKAVPRGFLMFIGVSGMCSPFTLEAQVDGALPDAAFVSTAAHELGHIAGFCPEDEATVIGYIAGLGAADGFARYACALSAYVELADQLAKGERESALAALPEVARQDLEKAEKAYRKYRVDWFSRLSWRAYDRYLQAQGIREGVRSYSRGITLFAYAWRQGLVAPEKQP